MKATASALILLATLPAEAGTSAKSTAHGPIVPRGGDWEVSLSFGPSLRRIGDLKANYGYHSAGVVLPSFVGFESLELPPIGDETGLADRYYNDGYVRPDAGTPGDGSTWFWGYDRADQVRDGQLVFQATGFQSLRFDSRDAPAGGPGRRDSFRSFMPHLQVDAFGPDRVGPFRLGFTAAVEYGAMTQRFGFSNFATNQTREDYRLDIEDRYDTGGIIVPGAPYAGGIGGPGPVIGSTPAGRDTVPVLLLTDTALFSNEVSQSFRLRTGTLNFGPALRHREGPWDITVSAGPMLNLFRWKASQSETLNVTQDGDTHTIAAWSDRSSGNTVRLGVYAQAAAAYQINESFSLGGYLRVDTGSGFNVRNGPTRYRFDPDGISAGLLLTYRLP